MYEDRKVIIQTCLLIKAKDIIIMSELHVSAGLSIILAQMNGFLYIIIYNVTMNIRWKEPTHSSISVNHKNKGQACA